MRAFFYASTLAYLWLPASGFADTESSWASRWQTALHTQSTTEQKLALLAEFSNGPLLPWALSETSALYYREGRWDQFFGAAYYLRTLFPDTDAGLRTQLLEILALLRHCQTDAARKLLAEAELRAQSTAWAPDFHSLVQLIGIGRQTPEPTPSKPSGASEHRRLWPLRSPTELQKLDPRRLRRKVPGLCEALEQKKGHE